LLFSTIWQSTAVERRPSRPRDAPDGLRPVQRLDGRRVFYVVPSEAQDGRTGLWRTLSYSDDMALPLGPRIQSLSGRLILSTDSAGKTAGDSSYLRAPIAQCQKYFTAFVMEHGQRIKLIANFVQSALIFGVYVFCHAACLGIAIRAPTASSIAGLWNGGVGVGHRRRASGLTGGAALE